MPRSQKAPGPHVHYLSLGQAALVSGIDRAVLRTLVRKGVLPTVRIPGGAWHLVSRSSVLAIKRQLDAGLEAA
jgi:predicted site-specific integrase-resolvase